MKQSKMRGKHIVKKKVRYEKPKTTQLSLEDAMKQSKQK